jgi:hypothetical protein
MLMIVIVAVTGMSMRGVRFRHERCGCGGGILQKPSSPDRTFLGVVHILAAPAAPTFHLFARMFGTYTLPDISAATLFHTRNRCQDRFSEEQRAWIDGRSSKL